MMALTHLLSGLPRYLLHQTNRFRRFYGKNVVIYFVVKKKRITFAP